MGLTITYIYWFRNIELPAPATIDLTYLPEKTLFVRGTSYKSESITLPPDMNVYAVVQYEVYGGQGRNNLILSVFQRDKNNPSLLMRERHEWLGSEEVWSNTILGHLAIDQVSVDGRIITVFPKKDYGTAFFAGMFLFIGLVACAGFAHWLEPGPTPSKKKPATNTGLSLI